jgi:hypothetical protein
MLKVRTPFNFDYGIDAKAEVNDLPSLTVPDQTMSVKEILERYARGLPLGAGERVPMYDEEDDLPDPRTLDLVDRQELSEQFKSEIEYVRAQQEEARKKEAEGQVQPKEDGQGEEGNAPA